MKTVQSTLIVFVLLGMVALVGCTRYVEPEAQNKATDQTQPSPNLEQSADNQQPADNSAAALVGDYNFMYPQGWQLTDSTENGQTVITIQNTDKQIVLGGVAPDDYYIESDGKNAVNTEKYANSYIKMVMTVYPEYAETAWDEFFDSEFPQIVEEHKFAQLPYREDLETVQVSKTSGLFAGQERFFVRTDQAIYDARLFYSQDQKDQAVEEFYEFISQFPY
ncbi:MAG TPA: hypothetical protein VKP03_00505 [Patescibacteria group bacterium]|nr:hypothetical protein [Patescibacteria group bacterium]